MMRKVRTTILINILMASCAVFAASASFGSEPVNTGVEPTIRPGDNFYGYANDAWLKTTSLPDGLSSLDTTAMLRAQNAQRVQDLIEEAVKATSVQGHRVKPDVQKIADYYASLVDTAGIEAKGFAPLSGDLAAVAAITDRRALATYLGQTLRLVDGSNSGAGSLWGIWIHQDFHDPYHYAAHLMQGGLGLGEKDGYLDSTPDGAQGRGNYLAQITNVLQRIGLDQPQIRAARVLELEIAIAATHASRADTDDVYKTDNSWRSADFISKAPGLEWDAYFSAAGLSPSTGFVVWQPQAVIGGSKLVATQPLDAWKDYLSFHLAKHYQDVLPSTIDPGASAEPDRKQQAIDATKLALGDAVGRLYVERYFSPRAKAVATDMVENIRLAFRGHVDSLTWMSPETKSKAQAKLAALRIGLGYPETWVNYSQLSIVRGDAFGNLKRAEGIAYRRELAKLNRRVDPNEWAGQLHPYMVGAILNISPNSMQFAAGLLQPPYFDAGGDAASNYGSAGAGIAHEISHSFDELGNQYDDHGRLVRWWTASDLTRYKTATEPLTTQLDSCRAGPNLPVQGTQVLSESASDLAGLAVAHDAYLLSLKGKPDVTKGGLSGEQRFFVAFAQRWRRLQTDDALRRRIETDNHAPPECRSYLVRNADAWVRAFDVKPDDALYLKPEMRIKIW
jgi:putative endopeptidase